MRRQCKYNNCECTTLFGHRLDRHIDDEHKKYECDKCMYRTAVKSHMALHVKAVDDKIKDIYCEKCMHEMPFT